MNYSGQDSGGLPRTRRNTDGELPPELAAGLTSGEIDLAVELRRRYGGRPPAQLPDPLKFRLRSEIGEIRRRRRLKPWLMRIPAAAAGFAFAASLFWFAWARPGADSASPPSLAVQRGIGSDDANLRPPPSPELVATALGDGGAYLLGRQLSNGSWLDDTAVTSLALAALRQVAGSPAIHGLEPSALAAAIDRGRSYLLTNVRASGAIHEDGGRGEYYTTSLALAALAVIDHPADRKVMRRARHFLLDGQAREDLQDRPTSPENPLYGGFSFSAAHHPDLSSTAWVVEALRLTEHLDSEFAGAHPRDVERSRLAWERLVRFLDTAQVGATPDSAAGPGAAAGGFVNFPRPLPGGATIDESLAADTHATYAGLNSYIYAGVAPEDPRVAAAAEWIRTNYALSDNPRRGTQGVFLLLQSFAKANAAYGWDAVETIGMGARDWRRDVVETLLTIQHADGSWSNVSGRWMESVPELATSHALVAMGVALNSGWGRSQAPM